MKKWKIKWESKTTGAHGEGEPKYETLEDAESDAKSLDDIESAFRHRVVMVDTKYSRKG